jgi:hypothetical protein
MNMTVSLFSPGFTIQPPPGKTQSGSGLQLRAVSLSYEFFIMFHVFSSASPVGRKPFFL